MTCEVCRFLLPEDYSWRARCGGCGNLHVLCVDCGCRHARRTGLQEPVWAELGGCPDEVAVAAAVAGDIGESAEQAVRRIIRELDPKDALTLARLVGAAFKAGLPAAVPMAGIFRPNAIGLRLADGREVWSQ